MKRLPWMRGPELARGAIFVSATQFTYRTYWPMPAVIWHSLRLRRHWGSTEGAVGMFSAVDLRTRTTYTVSAWTSEHALARWVRSAGHVRLMHAFRTHVESAHVVSWSSDHFERKAAWGEGLAQLRAKSTFEIRAQEPE